MIGSHSCKPLRAGGTPPSAEVDKHTRSGIVISNKIMNPPAKKKARTTKKKAVDERVVEEYANRIKTNNTRDLVTVHVVNVLTKQYGDKFPVALNTGTRPTICRLLRRHLGDERYKNLCVRASSDAGVDLRGDDFEVPALSQAPMASIGLKTVYQNATKENMLAKFPKDASQLVENGALRIPLLSPEEAHVLTNEIHSEYSSASNNIKTAKLSVTQGNGKNGEYSTIVPAKDLLLQRVIDATKEWIGESNVKLSRPLGNKSILLRYGLGGVNYAHHDDSGDYQAILMLSKPGVDYNGGVFYLAESDPPHAVHEFPFGQAGELIIFCGMKERYLHGMTEVLPGTGEETREEWTTKRFAVGLFQ